MSVVKNAESARLFVLASRQVLMVPVCVVLACALNRRAAKGDVSQGQDAFSNNDVCILVYIYAFMEKKKKSSENLSVIIYYESFTASGIIATSEGQP